VEVRFIADGSVTEHSPDELETLLARTDGFAWVDVPHWDSDCEVRLHKLIGLHPLVLKSCRERNHVPTIHAYPEHVFLVVHAPELGPAGHVHLLELNVVVAPHFLVTAHGPINPVVPIDEAMREAHGVLERIEAGRFKPTAPAELAYAIVSAVARRQRALIGSVAQRVPALESKVMEGDFRNPEALLEELYLLRHELVTVRTMAAQSHDIYARMGALDRIIPETDQPYAADLADQFDRIRSIADGESQFLFGVIDLYHSRVTTKMTMAMERLAVIAAVTLPITALASVYGMNVIVNSSTHWGQLAFIVLVMLIISGLLLRWTRKQGWW
jgi:Mg2+ and Co2+ transporter CorA